MKPGTWWTTDCGRDDCNHIGLFHSHDPQGRVTVEKVEENPAPFRTVDEGEDVEQIELADPSRIKRWAFEMMEAHRGSATNFCVTCPGWVPVDPEQDEQAASRAHQIEMMWDAGLLNREYWR